MEGVSIISKSLDTYLFVHLMRAIFNFMYVAKGFKKPIEIFCRESKEGISIIDISLDALSIFNKIVKIKIMKVMLIRDN